MEFILLTIVIVMLVLILAYMCDSLIKLNRSKDETIKEMALALSEVIAIEKLNNARSVAEDVTRDQLDEGASFNPHEYVPHPILEDDDLDV